MFNVTKQVSNICTDVKGSCWLAAVYRLVLVWLRSDSSKGQQNACTRSRACDFLSTVSGHKRIRLSCNTCRPVLMKLAAAAGGPGTLKHHRGMFASSALDIWLTGAYRAAPAETAKSDLGCCASTGERPFTLQQRKKQLLHIST